MPNYARHYIVSPHDDVNALFEAAVGMGVHRLSKSKLAVQPVFKDEMQRSAFNQMAKDWLANVGERTTTNQHEFDALTYLEDISRSSVPSTWMDFTRVENPSPKVYVQGHGAPGLLSITSDTHEQATAEEVAALLSSMELPPTSDVRANSCWSGAGQHYQGNEADWYERFHKGTLAEVSDPNGGFAAKLHHYLKERGFHGTVSGYLVPIAAGAADRLLRGGGVARHIGAAKAIVDDSELRPMDFVRKRDVRVRVPAPPPRRKRDARICAPPATLSGT